LERLRVITNPSHTSESRVVARV